MKLSEKMNLFRMNKVVNWHEHIQLNENGSLDRTLLEQTINMARSTHMDKLVCSRPVSGKDAKPEAFINCNDRVYEAMKLYPDMIEGMAFINPGYQEESLEEIDRCVGHLGMIGIKLYNQHLISDPVQYRIIEKCISLDIPILMHAGKLNFGLELQPLISHDTHFAEAARRYPEAVFIRGHIGGGGDWHWCLKTIAPYPNICIDISGSVCDEGMIEGAVSSFGAKRILFGTDQSFSAGIGKLLGARISDEDKIEILNNKRFSRYLKRGLDK